MEGLQAKRTNLFLIGLAFILLLLTFFAKDPFALFTHNQENSPSLISDFNIDKIQYLKTMKNNNILFTFQNGREGWRVFNGEITNEMKSYTVDLSWLQQGLEAIANAKKYQEVSSSEDSFGKFGVTNNAFQIILLDAKKEEIAKIYIGDTASTPNATFVRMGDSTSVYSVKGRWKDSWNKNLDDFRDKRLLVFSKDNILKITSKKSSNLLYTLELDDAQSWKVISANSSMLADLEKTTSLLNILENLKGTSFDDDVTGKPFLEFDLELSGGTSLSLSVFKKKDDRYVVNSSYISDYMFIPNHIVDRLSGYTKETLKKIEETEVEDGSKEKK